MSYFDLVEGRYNSSKCDEKDLWESFSWLFNKTATNDTSYKFIFFRSLLDCLDYGKLRLRYDSIFEKFTYYSWSLVLKYHIRQKASASNGRLTELENILIDYLSSNYNGKYLSWEEIDVFDKDKIISKVKSKCKRYVVGAFFGDTKELIYSFSRTEEWIEFNPLMYRFMKENKDLLLDLNYNKWSKFYMNRNTDELKDELENRIDKSVARKGENVFRTVLATEFEMACNEKEAAPPRVNTLELLFESDGIEDDNTELDPVVAEEELYKDLDNMTEYLKDPILFIQHLKQMKGIAN